MECGELFENGLTFSLAGVVVALLIKLLLGLRPGKWDEATLRGAVLRAMTWVDAAIPDDLQGDSRINRALMKTNRFAKVFPQAFSEIHGRRPSDRVIRLAKALVEEVCEERRRLGPSFLQGGAWESTPSGPSRDD